MFTGIVGTGRVARVRRRGGRVELTIASPAARGLRTGDSVAVNGVCLTAVRARRRRFAVQAVPETLARTTLGGLRAGEEVNVELAVRPSDRLGGHIVQGHVDGAATVTGLTDEDGSRRMTVSVPDALLRYVVPKGSVALDGVSLTVAALVPGGFEVALIPHTLEHTTLGRVRPGGRLNVEVDVLAKYVEKLVRPHAAGREA